MIQVSVVFFDKQSNDANNSSLPWSADLVLDEVRPYTINEVAEKAGLVSVLDQKTWASHAVGIFGKLKQWDTIVKHGDRIEIYQPLLADPKETRRRRAMHKATS